MHRDYYVVLNIPPKAGQEVIDGAYRRLALRYHPALNPSANARGRMEEINQAWEVLSDPVRRAKYDRSRLNAPETKSNGPDRNQGIARVIDQAARAPRGERIFHPAMTPSAKLILESASDRRVGIGIVVLLVALLTLWGGQGRFVWLEAIILCASLLTYGFFRSEGASNREWLGLAALTLTSVVILAMAFPEFNLGHGNAQAVSSGAPDVLVAAAARPSPTATQAPGCPRGCATSSFECVVKAHVDAEGNRIYYLPSDRQYDEIAMDPASSDRWFCSEAQATANGWVRHAYEPEATETPAVPALVTPVDERTLFVCAPIANVRSGPGLDRTVVKVSTQGTSWRVLGKVKQWYYVGHGADSQSYFIHETVLCADPSVPARATATPRPAQPAADSSAIHPDAAPDGYKYRAPRLLTPPNGARYQCARDLVLEWTLPDLTSLAEDEWFLVESKQQDHENWVGVTDWTKDRSVVLHPIKSAGNCDALWWPSFGVYEWRVIVISGDVGIHAIKKFSSPASSSLVIQYGP